MKAGNRSYTLQQTKKNIAGNFAYLLRRTSYCKILSLVWSVEILRSSCCQSVSLGAANISDLEKFQREQAQDKMPKKRTKRDSNKSTSGTILEYFKGPTTAVPPESPPSTSSEEQKPKKKRKKTLSESPDAPPARRSGRPRGKAFYKQDVESLSESSRSPSPKKEPIKVLNPLTRAFLDSGVPEVVIKAQKVAEKKMIENKTAKKKRKKTLSESSDTTPARRSGRPRGKASFKQEKPPSPSLGRSKRARKPIVSYFKDEESSSESSRSPSPKKKPKKVLNPLTRAFLDSGVPEVVLKAQKVAEKKIIETLSESSDTPPARRSGRPRGKAYYKQETPAPSSLSRSKRARKSIASYFKDEESSSSSESSRSPSPKKELKKVLNPLTRAFLDSGVPEVVMKAQKVVEKRMIEDEYLSMVDYFPKMQSCEVLESFLNADEPLLLEKLRLLYEENETNVENDFQIQVSSALSSFICQPESWMDRHRICCRSIADTSVGDDEIGVSSFQCSSNSLPWIEESKVEGLKDLVCDKEAISKLTVWLKQWKSDIKDDGGTSRKIELKKKRRGSSDSDFIESDEEEGDLKKKSLLLIGPSGCGKTVAVHVAAKHFGFHVVEVNFSSRRSGKDVLQRVEEAVKSHRVKNSHNCLLLFEDIDLIDPKEDEGFHSAVAQLITTAVRPIVMTSSSLGQLLLDPKLEKKAPLVIQFNYPKTSKLVRKVLLPLIKTRSSLETVADNEVEMYELKKISQQLSKLLDTICRHGRNDIRQVINQMQFLLTFSESCSSLNSVVLHQHSIQQESLVDLMYQRSAEIEACSSEEEDCDDENIRITVKARNRKFLQKLDAVSDMMSFLCDLDMVDSISSIDGKNQFNGDEEVLPLQIKALKQYYFDPNFCQSYYISCNDGVDEAVLQSLVIDNDLEVENTSKGYKLIGEIGDYCDNIWADGGWESAACVRTIIKQNMMDSVGRLAKRNGRVTSYFNRLDRQFTSRISDTFGFGKELDIVKEALD